MIQNDGEITRKLTIVFKHGRWNEGLFQMLSAIESLKEIIPYNITRRPAMLYGTQCWAVKGRQESKLNVGHTHTWEDMIRNAIMKEKIAIAPSLPL